jgi:hypothetical protein
MNSRWSTQPIKRNGQIIGIKPNVPGDIDILTTIRARTLPATYIAALTGRSYKAVLTRASLLKRKPHCLIKVHDTQLETPRIFQWSPQCLHLTPAGEAVLLDRGFEVKRPSGHFLHHVTQSQTEASFEIGTKAHGLKYEPVQRPNLFVSFSLKGKSYDNHRVVPDGGPIGIGYADNLYRFVVFETDLATENLRDSTQNRQSIEQKFSSYLTLLGANLHQTQWGLPGLLVLFTTLTETRMKSMIDLLSDMTQDSRLRRCFGFQVFQTILSGTPQPEDKGWAITRPWMQVGGTTLNLGEV